MHLRSAVAMIPAWLVARRLSRLAARAARHLDHALEVAERMRQATRTILVLDGRPASMRQLLDERARLTARVDHEPEPSGPERFASILHGAARLLLVIDVLALSLATSLPFPEFGDMPRGDVLVVATLLATLAVGTQAMIAAQLGRRLWVWRFAEERVGERPARDGVVLAGGGALAVLGGLTSWASYLWAEQRIEIHDSPTAVALGLALALPAAVTPWLLCWEQAFAPSPLSRRLRGVHAAIDRFAISRSLHRSVAIHALRRIEATLDTAERLHAVTEGWGAGLDQTAHPEWALQLAEVRAAGADAARAIAAIERCELGEDPHVAN